MHLRILMCLFLLFVVAVPPSSSDPSFPYSTQYVDPDRGLTLIQLLELAEKNSAQLLEANVDVQRAAALRKQASLGANPEIALSAGSSSIAGDSGETEWSASYQHPFELGGKRSNRTKVADLALKIAEADAVNRRRQVFAELSTVFAEVVAGAALLQAFEESVQLAAEIHRITAARVTEGEAPAVEKGLTEVEANRLHVEAATVGGEVMADWTRLRQTAGVYDITLKLKPELAFPFNIESKDLEELILLARTHRPDLKVAVLTQEMALAELALAKSEGVSDFRAFVEYSSEESRFDQLAYNANGTLSPIEDSDRIVSAGISMELPLFNRNQGNIQAAQSRIEAASIRKAAAEKAVDLQVQAAFERLRVAKANYEKFRDSILGSAREQTEIIRAAYEAGELRLFDLLTQQRHLLAIRQSFITTEREYFIAASELQAATAADLWGAQ